MVKNYKTVLFHPLKLEIIIVLIDEDKPVPFWDLKKYLEIGSGHLQQIMLGLEKYGLIKSNKTFDGRRTLTTFQVTENGKSAFEKLKNWLYVTLFEGVKV